MLSLLDFAQKTSYRELFPITIFYGREIKRRNQCVLPVLAICCPVQFHRWNVHNADIAN